MSATTDPRLPWPPNSTEAERVNRMSLAARQRAEHKHRVWRAMQEKSKGAARADAFRKQQTLGDGRSVPIRARAAPAAADDEGDGSSPARRRSVFAGNMSAALQQRQADEPRSALEIEQMLAMLEELKPTMPQLGLLAKPVCKRLCEVATTVTFEAGQWICRQGEAAEHFYIILSGGVQVCREHAWQSSAPPPEDDDAAHGTLQLIATLFEGDAFGEQALSEDVCARLRMASCRAQVRDTTCLCVSRRDFLEAQHAQTNASLAPAPAIPDLAPKREKSSSRLLAKNYLSSEAALTMLVGALKAAAGERSREQEQAIVAMARSIRFFLSLDAADCAALCERMAWTEAPANQLLIRTGDIADRFYVVLRGNLQVTVDGKVVATKGPGDAFGEMALLSSERRSADVLALQRCDLASLDRGDYLRVVEARQQEVLRQKKALLEAHCCFSPLPVSRRVDLATCLRPESFAAGQSICVQDAASEDLYILARGACAVVRQVPLEDGGTCQLQVNTIGRGELFGEVGVLHGAPRSATVVALRASDVYALSKYDLARFFGACPALRHALLESANAYPSDADALHRWEHDEAWAAYRRRLLAEIAPGGRARPNREGLAGVKALPAFRPPRPPPGGGGGGAGLRESELTQWASEHLSGTVLKSLHELVVSEPMPVMEG